MRIEAGFSMDGHEVLPLEGVIRGPGGPRHVEPKAMDVLLELARHAPSVRTRTQLEQAVWPRGFIGEDALTRCIGQLRRALGEDRLAPRLLQTIPRRGYRLQTMVLAQPLPAPTPAAPQCLLVLPFLTLSSGGDQSLARGLTELLIRHLCVLPGLRVLSRTTAMQFQLDPRERRGLREIAEHTGADLIVEGSVLQAGQRSQVVAQLIDAHTDTHLWAADFRSELQDVLTMQNVLAQRMTQAIGTQLRPADRPAVAAGTAERSIAPPRAG